MIRFACQQHEAVTRLYPFVITDVIKFLYLRPPENKPVNYGMTETVKIKDKEFKIMIPAEKIRERVEDIAARINGDYAGKTPVFLGVLNGAFLFLADLFRQITLECELSFIRVSSYSGTSSTGHIKNLIGLNENLQGRDIIIVEDIVDTGDTMQYLLGELNKLHPSSIRIATAVFKPTALRQPIKPDYVGFEVAPAFIVGYGLDYDGLGRNLKHIYVLNESPVL